MEVVSGAVIFESTVAASSDGYANALRLVEEHATGRRAFAIEGTGSFGAGLTRFLTGHGERVLEVGRLLSRVDSYHALHLSHLWRTHPEFDTS